MIDRKPCYRIILIGVERDDPSGLAFGFTSGVLSEAEVRCPVFIDDKLAIVPRGECFITKYVAELWEVFNQVFKLLGIMSIPWRGCEPVDHASVDIDADMEFDTLFSSILSFDPDVVPGAAVVGTKSGAVNCDVHLFSSEKSGDSVHHLANVGDGESFHPSLDHAMSGENWAVLFDGLAVFDVGFNAIVGLVESYFEETSYGYSLRVVTFSSFLVGFPWWWKLVNRFDHRFGEIGGEVAVHMVRNCWIYPFLCASHPRKR
jgi:hypothetical protein